MASPPAPSAASAEPVRARCSGGDGRAEREEGTLYFNGEGGKTRDLPRALELFEAACGCKDAEGCFNLGVAHDRGWGAKKDPARARPHYEMACELGFASGCFNLGILFELGEGVRADPRVSMAHFRRGCALGHSGSCQNVGVSLRDGATGSPDLRGARVAFARACELGDSGGCNDAAVMCEAGDGGPVDLAAAETLYRRACDQTSVACGNLGKFLLAKRGNVKGAHAAFDRGCEGGDEAACGLAGRRTGPSPH